MCPYGECDNVECSEIKNDDWILDLEDIEKDSGKILAFAKKSDKNSISTKHKFYQGQLLYSKLRPYLNKVVIAPKAGYCTSEILPLLFWGDIDVHYMQMYLMSNVFLSYTDKISYGVKMPRLGTADGKQALIALPPNNEQKLIAKTFQDILPALETIKTEQCALEDIINLLKSKVLELAIQGKLVLQDENDEPANVLLERIRTERKAKLGKKYVESYIFKGDDNCYYEKICKNEPVLLENLPFDIPDSWCWARLGDIGDWGAGATPPRGNLEYYGGNIPWVKTGELNDDYIFLSVETVSSKALQECSLRYNKIGDILIAMYGATIGKLGIAGVKLTTNQACCACTPYEGVYNIYLFYYLKEEKDRFTKLGTGGAQPNISREKIINYLIPIPPYNEQLRICEQVKNIFNTMKGEN